MRTGKGHQPYWIGAYDQASSSDEPNIFGDFANNLLKLISRFETVSACLAQLLTAGAPIQAELIPPNWGAPLSKASVHVYRIGSIFRGYRHAFEKVEPGSEKAHPPDSAPEIWAFPRHSHEISNTNCDFRIYP
jgi:hypothetical protein